MYSEKVMEHFQNPRNVGEIENACGMGSVEDAVSGDMIRIYLDMNRSGIISDCKFTAFGCGAVVAAASVTTELIKGKTVQEAAGITKETVMEALDGLPASKAYCTRMAEEAVHAALLEYAKKNRIVTGGFRKPGKDI